MELNTKIKSELVESLSSDEGRTVKLLELFAGSRSVGRVAERLGMQVFSVDVEPFDGVDLMKDIEFLDRSDIPFVPDVIWASPPCTTYSLAAISHHRHGIIPMSDQAAKADKVCRDVGIRCLNRS